jgi:RND family efflux transporter MFP subunit
MKFHRTGILIVLVLALAAVAGTVFFIKRQQATASHPTSQTSGTPPKAITVLELTPREILTVQSHTLLQTVPISGTVKAVKTAAVKVRVAGEIQGLVLREGDAVKAGQIVATIDSTEVKARLRQAKDQADTAKAQVDIAQRQFDNNQALVQQGFISKTALDNAAANLNGAQASYQAALAAVDIVRRTLEDTVLRAPISGWVGARFLQNGERAGVDARVVDIVDLSKMELEAVVPPQDASALRVGQSAQLRLDGPQPVILAAQVARINPTAQAGSRGVVVYLNVPAHPALKNGLFAQGDVRIGSVETLAIPLDAVRADKPAPYVQKIVGAKVVHQRVTAGLRGQVGNAMAVAVQGLAEGDQILVGSLGQLREGTPVQLTTGAFVPSGASSAALGN